MAKINILDQDTINLIAAGEVVERPASVVKELVENAIDAGASAVSVHIEGGGVNLIRITDNGSGFDADDIRIAFKKNTTSKIKSAVDLQEVMTFGFRGEALSSIAAVAKVELLTRKPGELTGKRYCISGGVEELFEDVGCPEGTTLVVKDLFYNTPVRRKFLKAAMTEAGYVNDACEHIALAHPEVALKFTNNGRQIISTTGKNNLKEVVYMIYGRSIAEQLMDVEFEAGDMKITGVIARPLIARGNRNYENYFLNGRFIKNGTINKAIEEAYRTYLMQGKYPFTVLSLSVPASRFDVNVHPAKLEVRFEDVQSIYEFVFKAVFDTVRGKERILESTVDEASKKELNEKPIQKSAPEPFERPKTERIEKQIPEVKELPKYTNDKKSTFSFPSAYDLSPNLSTEEETPVNETVDKSENVISAKVPENTENIVSEETKTADIVETVPVESESTIVEETLDTNSTIVEQKYIHNSEDFSTTKCEQLSFLSPEAVKSHRIIGQLFDTYWMIEYDDKLYIIDQHAAHERVLYEKLVKEYREGSVNSQYLYPAPIIELSLAEADKLNRVMDKLNAMGYEIEPFGGREYRVLAVPEGLSTICKEDMLLEFIDGLTEDLISGSLESVSDKLASMSCKAAVKGNTRLSETEAKALIEQLLSLENPFHCPHGRPIEISFSKYEIEKKFKRIV